MSSARRTHGAGSIESYPVKGDRRYRIVWRVPRDPDRPEAGRRKRSRGGFATETEAAEALRVEQAKQVLGLSEPADRMLFRSFARRWLDAYGESESTRAFVSRVIEDVDPYIGGMRLDQVRPSDLAGMYRGLEQGRHQKRSRKRSRKGLAKSTVARYAGWVVTIFRAAEFDGIITSNPASNPHSGRPRGPAAQRVKPFQVWTSEQLRGFLDWAEATGRPWWVAYVLFARTGMRSGELLGLRWGDVDLKGSQITIARAVRYDTVTKSNVAIETKTRRSRSVAIDGRAVQSLLTWREELRRLSPDMVRNPAPVFPDLPGRRGTKAALNHAFQRAQRNYRADHPDLDLPQLCVHDLRHTHASLLLHAGVGVKVVQDRLGHANAQRTLNTYAHLMPDSQHLAASALERMLGGDE